MSLICAVPLLSALFAACDMPPPFATGYVEGDFVMIAPFAVAQVSAVNVERGDHVAAGAPLVAMEKRDAEIALAEARAAEARAASQLANLQEGRRPEEIRVLEATLTSARAQSDESVKEVTRQQSLNARNVSPEAQLDQARTAAEVAAARVAEAEANLAVARLPARAQEIDAARATLAQARAAREAAEWQLSQRALAAPAAGTIYDVVREPGEIAGPSAPVLSFLPDGAVKLRLYVPEPSVAQIRPGTRLQVNCDGCTGQNATVSYVSDSPEFTPPVIYSLQNRQKLVFLVEARPDPGSDRLKPGQIVDVDLSAP